MRRYIKNGVFLLFFSLVIKSSIAFSILPQGPASSSKYDMRETIEAVEAKLQAKGEKSGPIKKKLEELGIPKSFIRTYISK